MKGKRFLSILLTLALAAGLLPAAAISAAAAEPEIYTVSNDYIRVDVSTKNGGFAVRTADGSILHKSDDNKDLLYHDGAYDTSFLSLEIDGKYYLFGGKYGDSSAVKVTQDGTNGSVSSVWSVAGITFTETAAVENIQNGMLAFTLTAVNSSGTAVPVKARLLLDTCLGGQDCGTYVFSKTDKTTDTAKTEKMRGSGYDFSSFYTVDSTSDPQITAYNLNTDDKPYQVAVGHWNHLASTLFDFKPTESLDFTDNSNDAYGTADSACALYFDMGQVTDRASFSTFYGVYSNSATPASQSVAVNLTAPTRLSLNTDKSAFQRQSSMGSADFEIGADLENYKSTATNITLAVRTTGNLKCLSENGQEMANQDYGSENPYTITYSDLKLNSKKHQGLYFKAQKTNEAAYERITVGVYDTGSSANLTEQNLIGEKSVYILLPGADGGVPKVSFTNMSPATVYSSGTRHLYVTLKNPSMLDNRANWTLKAVSADGTKTVPIPSDNITINNTTGVMDAALTDDVQLAVGSWQLRIDWADSVVGAGKLVSEKYAKQTADILRFTVSADQKFKNDAYGVVAVAQYNEPASTGVTNPVYRIKTFKDEADFTKFQTKAAPYDKENYVEILLIYRGEFTVKAYTIEGGVRVPTYLSAVSTKTLDTSTQQYKVDNCVTVNGCMDFEGGTIAIYYESYKAQALNSAVCTEFDGELYTSDARTSIWKGKAIFTKLEQGKEFSLLPYDANGKRSASFQDGTIKLIWPSVAGAAQTIAGMVFKLAYGELGVMTNNDGSKGRVVSFSAKLNLSFTGKSDDESAPQKQNFWYKFTSYWKDYKDGRSLYDYAYNKMDATNEALDWSNLDESPDENSKQISASALVQDILFGCGEGFVGVNFKVSIALQNYIDGLPKLSCTLAVNTIGNWSFGLEGNFKMDTFKLQVRVSFMSYDNVPVPDEYYAFIGGFKPGLNVDGCGVVWLTGAGGGMSGLYKTIFCSGVPPLKLVMSASVSIMQVLSGQGTLKIGPTGMSATIEDLKVEGLSTPLVPRAMYSIEWYPGIDMRASIKVSILKIIEGSGYMVLKTDANYENPFFEAFARGTVNIPASVPALGGMSLAAVNLGLNSDKVWGSLKVITLKLGLTYYWGADGVDFGTGEEAQPTYPQLLGSVVPVGYSKERGQTLYARIGTNVSMTGEAQVVDDFGDAVLMAAGDPVIYSNGQRTLHKFNLGAYNAANPGAIVSLSYDAESLADAKTKAAAFKVNSQQNMKGTDYALTMYNGSNAENCNANVTYDETTKRATFAFSVSDSTNYGKDWYITTGTTAASALLYGVKAIPEVTEVNGTAASAGSGMTATWDGSSLAGLSKMSFYLTPVNNDPTVAGYSIGEIKYGFNSKTVNLTVPANVPAGDYYLRCVYSKDEQTNGAVYSKGTIHITNANTPAAAGTPAVKAAGDLKIGVTVPQSTDANTKGYEVTVYKADGSATDISALRHDKAASGGTSFEIGGSYTDTAGKTVGLEAGTAYRVGVTPYCLKGDAIVYGAETMSASITLSAPATPTLTVAADKTKTALSRTVGGKTQSWDTYAASAVTFTAASTQTVTGTWTLDSGESAVTGSFTGTKNITVPLTGLSDGDHSLTFTGSNPTTGDGFTQTYVFTTDTTPPRLMLTSPVNGSVFGEDGTLTVSGVTDADALLSVTCDGVAVCTGKTVAQLGGTIDAEGVFSAKVKLANPDASCTHKVVVKAADAVGNSLSYASSVTHGGLGDLAAMDIQYNGLTPQNGNIPVGNSSVTAQLRLLGTKSKGGSFVMDTENITWSCTTINGKASVSDSGVLSAAAGSQGFVTGRLEVTEGAFLTASSSFGADNGSGLVATNATLGGTVTGGGYYDPGKTVTLTAVPDAGYSFKGWTITGVKVSSTSSATISFTMPSLGSVTATANFVSNSGGGGSLPSGKLLTAELPAGADPNTYVPYYYDSNGVKTYVTFSAVINGKLVYMDPGAKCSFEKHSVPFTDDDGHWAKSDIAFAAARGLFSGVGGGAFDPNGTVNRAMFVTVLWRMAGSPSVSTDKKFKDVPDNSWYAKSVAWAVENNIVSGYGNGSFGPLDPITREQMCMIIMAFVRWSGLDLKAVAAKEAFSDGDSISSWARGSVETCQTAGLIKGRDNHCFDPAGFATRAESSTIIRRMIENLLTS